jgi:hypothetical protein
MQYMEFDKEKFLSAINNLNDTRYSLDARTSDAPQVTHCVSAVRYALEQSTWHILPYYYVGDMCRRLLDIRFLGASIVPIEDWDLWDLVFFHRKSVTYKVYMITHVGILLDDQRFFHSTWWRGGIVENLSKILHQGNVATCRILSSLTDPRGK